MKTFFVKSIMSEIGEYESRVIGTGKFNRSFLGKKKEIMKETDIWVKTGNSDCHVDGEKTAKNLEKKLLEIEMEGFSIVAVEPIISGSWNHKTGTLTNTDGSTTLPNRTNAEGWGFGYGFSYTSGYLILAKENKQR